MAPIITVHRGELLQIKRMIKSGQERTRRGDIYGLRTESRQPVIQFVSVQNDESLDHILRKGHGLLKLGEWLVSHCADQENFSYHQDNATDVTLYFSEEGDLIAAKYRGDNATYDILKGQSAFRLYEPLTTNRRELAPISTEKYDKESEDKKNEHQEAEVTTEQWYSSPNGIKILQAIYQNFPTFDITNLNMSRDKATEDISLSLTAENMNIIVHFPSLFPYENPRARFDDQDDWSNMEMQYEEGMLPEEVAKLLCALLLNRVSEENKKQQQKRNDENQRRKGKKNKSGNSKQTVQKKGFQQDSSIGQKQPSAAEIDQPTQDKPPKKQKHDLKRDEPKKGQGTPLETRQPDPDKQLEQPTTEPDPHKQLDEPTTEQPDPGKQLLDQPTTEQPDPSKQPDQTTTKQPDPDKQPDQTTTEQPDPDKQPDQTTTEKPDPGKQEDQPTKEQPDPGKELLDQPTTEQPDPDKQPDQPTTEKPDPGKQPDQTTTEQPDPDKQPDQTTTEQPDPDKQPDQPTTEQTDPDKQPDQTTTEQPDPDKQPDQTTTEKPDPGKQEDQPTKEQPDPGKELVDQPTTEQPDPDKQPDQPTTEKPDPDKQPDQPTTEQPDPGKQLDEPTTEQPDPDKQPGQGTLLVNMTMINNNKMSHTQNMTEPPPRAADNYHRDQLPTAEQEQVSMLRKTTEELMGKTLEEPMDIDNPVQENMEVDEKL